MSKEIINKDGTLFKQRTTAEILEQAMELIAEKIESNNNE